MKPINVTEPYLPPLEEYVEYLKGIWGRNWLTNQGPLVRELESTFIHQHYLDAKQHTVEIMGHGMTWIDTRTHETLLEAGQYVAIIEGMQGLAIACPKKTFISKI